MAYIRIGAHGLLKINMEPLDSLADSYFTQRFGISLAALLAPIGSSDSGESLAQSPLYREIRSAREEEDASLPLGAWERELKRADWATVSRLCSQALATRSKDLQLAAWLLEAEIHQQGFQALAPCLALIGKLCQTSWPQLYPQDPEHRDKLFYGIANKMNLPLRRTPFTATGSGTDYGLADWEQAQRNEQIRAALGKAAEQNIEGTTLDIFSAALACTPSTDIIAIQEQLAAAQTALTMLDETLQSLLGDEAPMFDSLRNLIENIALMLESEIRKRT